jgi:hypothetical protein
LPPGITEFLADLPLDRSPEFAVVSLSSLASPADDVRSASVTHLEPEWPGVVEVTRAVLGCLAILLRFANWFSRGRHTSCWCLADHARVRCEPVYALLVVCLHKWPFVLPGWGVS